MTDRAKSSHSNITLELHLERSTLHQMGIDAERSLALPGSRMGESNLRARLQRCIFKNRPLVVAAVGNSMTDGAMNCMARHPFPCARNTADVLATQHLRWGAGLQQILQRALPCRVDVPVRASGGAGSIFFSTRFRDFVRADDDVVIADWSISDALSLGRDGSDFEAGEELFVRQLRALRPHPPSFIHMESYPSFETAPMPCANRTAPAPRAVCEYYGTPLVSFMLAVCSVGDALSHSPTPALRHWRAACTTDGSEARGQLQAGQNWWLRRMRCPSGTNGASHLRAASRPLSAGPGSCRMLSATRRVAGRIRGRRSFAIAARTASNVSGVHQAYDDSRPLRFHLWNAHGFTGMELLCRSTREARMDRTRECDTQACLQDAHE